MDPNLATQIGMNGGHIYRAPQSSGTPAPRMTQIGTHSAADIDATPKVVAGFVVGAVALLFFFRVAGFRFSFGANVGG